MMERSSPPSQPTTCAPWCISMTACQSASASSTASPWEDPNTAGFTTPAVSALAQSAWTTAAKPSNAWTASSDWWKLLWVGPVIVSWLLVPQGGTLLGQQGYGSCRQTDCLVKNAVCYNIVMENISPYFNVSVVLFCMKNVHPTFYKSLANIYMDFFPFKLPQM